MVSSERIISLGKTGFIFNLSLCLYTVIRKTAQYTEIHRETLALFLSTFSGARKRKLFREKIGFKNEPEFYTKSKMLLYGDIWLLSTPAKMAHFPLPKESVQDSGK